MMWEIEREREWNKPEIVCVCVCDMSARVSLFTAHLTASARIDYVLWFCFMQDAARLPGKVLPLPGLTKCCQLLWASQSVIGYASHPKHHPKKKKTKSTQQNTHTRSPRWYIHQSEIRIRCNADELNENKVASMSFAKSSHFNMIDMVLGRVEQQQKKKIQNQARV